MTVLHIGTADFVGSRASYWKIANLVELKSTHREFPRAKALRGLRKAAPEDAQFFVTAHQLVTHRADDPGFGVAHHDLPEGPHGHFRQSPAVLEAWARTVAAAEAVQATGVLFRTPMSFTPSRKNRDALELFASAAKASLPEGTLLAWEPMGLWEAEEIRDFAESLGLLWACDPLRNPPDGPRAYLRLRGLLGVRRGYSENDFLEILEILEDLEEAWLVLDYPERQDDLKRLARLRSDSDERDD